ncbi:site-specific integrase [Corynebacterium suedekumii]|nr:site-specific integrase [Corynebacterium suedekumii]
MGDTKPTPVTDILDMLAATGVRIGEVLALRWEDVDLDAGTVTIAGTVVDREGRQADGGGTMRQDHPKTHKSHRTLLLPEWILPDLMEWRVMADNDLLFPNAWGGVMGPNGFRRKFRELRGEDYAWVTPKTYRKAVATIIAREMGDDAAAGQLGHASAATTRTHYKQRPETAGDHTHALEMLNPKR